MEVLLVFVPVLIVFPSVSFLLATRVCGIRTSLARVAGAGCAAAIASTALDLTGLWRPLRASNAGFILAVALPFLPDGGSHSWRATYAVSAGGAVLFGALAYCSYRFVRRLSWCAVAIDEESLWPASFPRATGLLRWSARQPI